MKRLLFFLALLFFIIVTLYIFFKPKDAISPPDEYQGRKIIGVDAKKVIDTEKKDEIKIENEINSEWQELLVKNLSEYKSHPEGKFKITPVRSVLYMKDSVGVYAEEVIVEYSEPNGAKRSSYKALVDSETGKTIETWSQSINEKSMIPRLIPDGVIQKDFRE